MPFCDRVQIQKPPIPFALAFLVVAILFPGSASAQTVIVQSAPPGATVELTFNAATVVTTTADTNGDATMSLGARTSEAGVLVFIDSCGALIRVHLVNRGVQPDPAPPSCTRTDVGSVFSMQPITTFVVDIVPTPAVHVKQGPAPPEWLLRGPAPRNPSASFTGKPTTGLDLSAGAGFSMYGNTVNAMCGNASPCQITNFAVAEMLGAEYWFSRYVGAYAGYLRPGDGTADGSGTAGSGNTFHFNSSIVTRLFNAGVKAGAAVGPARLYGLGGLNHHEATITTTQTEADTTVSVNGVTQTIKGGTQSFGAQTKGWNWVAGGGAEAWANRWIAIYGEVTVAKVKGTPVAGGEGGIDDIMTFAFIGVRVHLTP